MQKLYYQFPGTWFGDCMPFGHGDKFYLYHQRDTRKPGPFGEPFGWDLATTSDFVHYEDKGVAIPRGTDEEQDQFIFAGSVFEAEGQYHIFYTGYNRDYPALGKPSQVLMHAYSDDLVTWHKTQDALTFTPQEGYDPDDWRDPWVIRDEENDQYLLILGARLQGPKTRQTGRTVKFTSKDLKNWKFDCELTTENAFGYMWECPDYFTLEGQKVLSVSPQGLTREEFCFQNIYQSGYFILKDGKPEEKDFREWDHGFDFYAPQTFQDGKDRRIIIGWMGMPDADEEYVNPTAESEGWQHCLTVPREVTYKNGMLYQYPVKELNGLRENGTSISGSSVELPVNGPFDLDIQVKGDQGKVSLGENLFLEYQGGDVILTLSETAGAGRKVRKAHVPSGKVESLRILADTTAVEIYVNGGEVVFSTRYYPETQAQAVKVEAADVDGKIYGLKNYVME